jgi:glucose/arabinose dehydrogenase
MVMLAGCVGIRTSVPVPPVAATATHTVLPTSMPETVIKSASTPQPTMPRTPTPPSQRAAPQLGVEPFVSGLQRPVYLTQADDGTDRFFVVEQPGRIRVIANGQLRPTLFLDVEPLALSTGNEQGLLSVAFHPNYKSNGLFFVNYTRKPDGATVIARYRVSADLDVADPNSAMIVMTIDQPQVNHNGGLIKFGPDGYLYIGMGDGGGQGDQHGTIGNGQDLGALLGKILRIDVSREPYAVPASNPFVNKAGARPEIWALGLRNPWRFSFDRATGDLVIADVGQNTYEEIDWQPASSRGGENYGWRLMEGEHCYNPGENCQPPGLTLPVAEYTHSSGCSVTGGYVYRGSKYPWLNGWYLFTDYCTGNTWSLERSPAGAWQMTQRMKVDFQTSSFGEDRVGELYLIGHNNGTIYRLTSSQ